MPIRTIKPQFFRSRKLASVSRDARLTLVGLWVEADGHGRGSADPHVLKGAVWPLDHDITHETVLEHLYDLSDAEQIVLFEVDEEPYFEVVGWEKHQAANYRRGEPQHPSPQDGTIQTRTVAPEGKAPGSDTFARKSVQRAHESVLEGKGREGKGSASTSDEQFATFWTRYPKKVGKKAAVRAWAKMTGPEQDQALEHIGQHADYWAGKLTAPGTFVPEAPDPATWLNAKRWEDELPIKRTSQTVRVGGVNMARGAM